MMNKMQIFDFLGMTKDGEVDNAQVQATMKAMAEKAAEMGKFPEADMDLMRTAGPMTNMDAQMMNRMIADAPYLTGTPMGRRPMSDAESAVMQQIRSYAGPQTNADAAFLQQSMPGQQMRSPMGPMTDRDAAMMRQYAPQSMSMQQIMTMLKRAGY